MSIEVILDLVYYPREESKLRQMSKNVTVFNQQTHHLIKSMLATMQHHQGIGLAAPQIGKLDRLFVMEVPEHEHLPKIFVNPILVEQSEELMEYEEGCLSIVDYRAKITRPKYAKIEALDAEGNPFTVELEGLPAICAQHEIDHLNGKLFIDYISHLKRSRLKKKMLKDL